jgi:hypothetical protein
MLSKKIGHSHVSNVAQYSKQLVYIWYSNYEIESWIYKRYPVRMAAMHTIVCDPLY